jgi:sec-independent protein translocase protein TatA
MTLLFLSSMGPMEIVLIAFLVLLMFGGKKIPELMKGLGRGVREFNDAKNSVTNEIKKGMNENPEDLKEN